MENLRLDAVLPVIAQFAADPHMVARTSSNSSSRGVFVELPAEWRVVVVSGHFTDFRASSSWNVTFFPDRVSMIGIVVRMMSFPSSSTAT